MSNDLIPLGGVSDLFPQSQLPATLEEASVQIQELAIDIGGVSTDPSKELAKLQRHLIEQSPNREVEIRMTILTSAVRSFYSSMKKGEISTPQKFNRRLSQLTTIDDWGLVDADPNKPREALLLAQMLTAWLESENVDDQTMALEICKRISPNAGITQFDMVDLSVCSNAKLASYLMYFVYELRDKADSGGRDIGKMWHGAGRADYVEPANRVMDEIFTRDAVGSVIDTLRKRSRDADDEGFDMFYSVVTQLAALGVDEFTTFCEEANWRIPQAPVYLEYDDQAYLEKFQFDEDEDLES